MKKILFALSIIAVPAIAQTPSMQWQKTINGLSSGYDDSRKAWKDANGNYYITGTSNNDAFVVKVDGNGNTLLKFTYDGPQSNSDYGFDVKADGNGNIYLAGITVVNSMNAPFVAKYNASGTKLWEYVQGSQSMDGMLTAIALDNYASPANIYYTGSRNDSAITTKLNSNTGALVWRYVYDPGQILDIDIDNNAHPLICGYIANSGTNNPDLFAAQLDINTGYPMRYFTMDGAVADSVDHSFGTQHFDKATKIKAGPAGTFAVLGSLYNNVGRATIVVLKWGSAGTSPVWVYYSNAPTTYTEGEGVQLQADASFSNFYYLARANNNTGGYTTYSIVGKVNSTGSSVWEKEYVQGCSTFDPQDMAIDGNGNPHMVANGNNSGLYDVYYLKLSSANGNIISNLVYDNLRGGGTAYDIVYSIYVDITGHPYFFGSSDGYTYTQMDALMVRLNTNSTLDWDEVFDFFTNTQDHVFKMHLFPPVGAWGDQIVTCGTVYNNITNQDAVITSYDEMGNVLFEATFDENNDNESVIGFERIANYSNYLCTSSGSNPVTITQYYPDGTINGTPFHPTFNFTSPQQYALDTIGNSFVTANGYGSDDYMLGILTAGYVSVNNAPNTNPSSNAYCLDVVGDNLNNAYIAGVHSTGSGTLRKIMVQKYDLSGNKIWSTELVGLDSTAGYIGFITKIAYDRASSSIYVTAFVQTVGASNVKTALARIDLNGNVLWMKTYDAGGTRNELMTTIVVKNGFIYLTGVGQSLSNQSDNFEAVEKWDVNGNFIWGNSYNGPVPNANERGDGIVVDNAGNVYVTGISNEVGGAYGDILTLKYDANGNQLWKQEFNGPYNGEDDGQGIALSLTNTTNPRVYVCGTTQGGQGLFADIVTLKYCDLPAATVSTGGASTSICQNSSLTLAATGASGGGSYMWTPGGSSSAVITVNTGGQYYFTYTEPDGCTENSDTVTVTIKTAPAPLQICMVTVDDSSKHNLVMWDKTGSTPDVIGYNIYRESLPNVYSWIGSVPYDSLSQFVDPTGDPNITTYRYKISQVDSCGNESTKSNYHNTIFVTSNGAGTFNWNTYDVENSVTPVDTFFLMRDDLNTGAWHAIGSTVGTQHVLNDPNFATYQPTASWRVETKWNIVCTPTLRYNGHNASQTAIIKSKSNITNNRVAGIQTSTRTMEASVFPNPAKNDLTVIFPLSNRTLIKMRSVVGEEVLVNEVGNANTAQLDISKLAPGVYLLEVNNSNGKFIQRIIKE